MKYINSMIDSREEAVKIIFNHKSITESEKSKIFGLNDSQIKKMIEKIDKVNK